MRFRMAGDVMTGDVVSVGYATPVGDAVRSLVEHGIGGLPVVDEDDRVVGVVSRNDLTPYRTGPGGLGPRDPVTPPGRHTARDTTRDTARDPTGELPAGLRTAGDLRRTAGELMSTPAVTVRAIDTVALTARTLATGGIGRLPVVDEEARLIGMITRRDLLRVLVRPDSDIRDEILDDVMARTLLLNRAAPLVSVRDGVVTLAGHLEQDRDRSVAVRMAAQVDGVVAVVDHLTGRGAQRAARPALARPAGRGEYGGGGRWSGRCPRSVQGET
ncbi:CBS domain-containing protein [Streptomyces sp. NPDC059398]|uniref:CBS domain-containing protein n=1 Tax=Streptomyces sp. NPDC059398 TaxID=3346820 RepID=UPI0036C0AD97